MTRKGGVIELFVYCGSAYETKKLNKNFSNANEIL